MKTSGNYESVFTFLSKLNNGISKPNRFRVIFSLPAGTSGNYQGNAYSSNSAISQEETNLNSSNGGVGEIISVFCHSCNLPQRSLLTFEHKQFGSPYRAPYSSVYEPVTFSFYADESLNTRRYFEVWQQAVINIGTNTLNYYNEYTSKVTIEALSPTGTTMYTAELKEAYPLSVGSVDLAYANTNQVTNVTVTLSYRYWSQKGDSSSSAAFG